MKEHPYIKPTKHNMKRRALFHDYGAPCCYMLTLATKFRDPLFGSLVDEPQPHVCLSKLGHAIRNDECAKITQVFPMVQVWRVCIMPDHIHLLMNVRERLPEGKSLGSIVNGFKSGCNKVYWKLTGRSGVGLFEDGYNDRVIPAGVSVKGWQKYMCDNPRRLAIKRRYPHYFTVLHEMVVGGETCNIVGNRFLLDIPDKMPVIVHRADDEQTYARNCARWMACGERGGVLVSAAVAPREKEVLRKAMDRGYAIILLRENGFPPLYKPAGEAFDACAEGRLLQVSPWPHHNERRTITREQCLHLNALASRICNPTQTENPAPKAPGTSSP